MTLVVFLQISSPEESCQKLLYIFIPNNIFLNTTVIQTHFYLTSVRFKKLAFIYQGKGFRLQARASKVTEQASSIKNLFHHIK